jgi:hypothetical protein
MRGAIKDGDSLTLKPNESTFSGSLPVSGERSPFLKNPDVPHVLFASKLI